MSTMNEDFAAGLLALAIRKKRAAELLECLFDGGAVTFDPVANDLVLIPGTVMKEWMDRQSTEDEGDATP